MPKSPRPNANIYYDIHGDDGPWITLVNGYTRTSSDFRLMTKQLVNHSFRVLTLDNRGSGQSEVFDKFSVYDMADDIAALWKETNITKSHLLGISMGGALSQIVAIRYAENVNKLILVSTASESKFIKAQVNPWKEDLASIEQTLSHYFSDDFVSKNKLLIQAMAKNILKAIKEKNFIKMAEMQRRAIEEFSAIEKLKNIDCPTLIIHGDQDIIVEPEAATQLASHIKNSTVVFIPNAGHLLLAEKPHELYQLVLTFIN